MDDLSDTISNIKKSKELSVILQETEGQTDLTEADKSDSIFKEMCASIDTIRQFYAPAQPSSSSNCFIATAAYATSQHTDLDTFRQFRDEKLLTNPLGNWMVEVYYYVGPNLADLVRRIPWLRKVLRTFFEKLAQWMRENGINLHERTLLRK